MKFGVKLLVGVKFGVSNIWVVIKLIELMRLCGEGRSVRRIVERE